MDLIKIYKENEILNDYINIYFDDENLKNNNKNLTYKISHIIGNGVYGVVYKADCLENGNVVALKQTYQKSAKYFKEIEIMKKLKHPNIVKLKHAFYTSCPNGGIYVHMVMEYGNTDLATSLYYITIKNSEHVNKTYKNINNSKYIKNDKDNNIKLKNDCTNFIDSEENTKCVNNNNINSINESENTENLEKLQMNKCDENCMNNTHDPNYNNMNKSENKCNEKNIDENSYNNSEKEINSSNNNNVKSENDCLNNYGNIINNFNINMLQENINNICSCHNLSDYIKKSFFNENQVKIYLYQLIRATLYLHSLCITHRDIKPQNILIFLNKPNDNPNNSHENENQKNKKCVVCIHNSVKFKCIMNKRNMNKNLDENNNVNEKNAIVNNDCNNNEYVVNNSNAPLNKGGEKYHKNYISNFNSINEDNDIKKTNKENGYYNCCSTPISLLSEKKKNSTIKHVREKRSMSFSNTYTDKNNNNDHSDYVDNSNKNNLKKSLKRSKTDLVVSFKVNQTNTFSNEQKETLPLSDVDKNCIDSCKDIKEKNEITNLDNDELDNIYDENNLDKIYMNSVVYKYIKLCDFNTSTKLKENYKYLSYVCSRYYRAPELLFGSNYYSHAIDTWSIGCVMGELILGKPLFLGDCASDQLVEIIKILGTPNDEDFLSFRSVYKNVKFPNIKPITLNKLISNNSSKESIDLLDKLLQFNPKKRIKLCSALLHNYFDDIRNFKVFNTNTGSDKTNYTLPYITNCFNFTKEELLHYTVEERKILIPSEIRKHKLGEVTQYIDMTLDHFNQLYPNKVNLAG
ncbi:uncharacterized protein PY17X_0709900 [Plasmodium yoelii]|uniref:Protein kinase 1 n=3 Tax=Plasmodium yoelii TaxID=5861 RepID=A0AAE9WTQ5_PLAYO|nr:uncharacterized protein PY17X_0709900 [Plasmodium yoelii]EAA17991.1 protein kinase-related [Plasmodium yoelii yoelii]WBY56318.1 protein kinase 1 [Plasmodium yoelii yoelii]CDU17219.1 protein kinase 1 [Plasmodium yoelii]VTZ76377.1 protein kinase 1 [Plasmodium yoelii]|eukprot:XP_726426.1 uncharacterized protein PY17X_0709900 [Plasmodium yoelii]